VLGMILFLPQIQKLWFLYFWIISFNAVVVAFHVYARYRLPVVVYLMPFVGGAVERVYDFLGSRKWWHVSLISLMTGLLIWGMSLSLTQYSHAQSYFNLGSGLSKLGDQEGAAEAYQHALSLSNDYVPALINLGKIAYGSGDVDSALNYWNRAYMLQPDSEEIHNNLGALAISMGNVDQAEYHFKESVRIQPNYFLGWLHLAQVCQMKNDHLSAMDAFDHAISLNPENAQALYGKAKSSDIAQKPDAVSLWMRYINIAKKDPSERDFLEEAEHRLEQLQENQKND
jgi:tetratricopeptide (TPR) repeat protein